MTEKMKLLLDAFRKDEEIQRRMIALGNDDTHAMSELFRELMEKNDIILTDEDMDSYVEIDSNELTDVSGGYCYGPVVSNGLTDTFNYSMDSYRETLRKNFG